MIYQMLQSQRLTFHTQFFIVT